MRRALIYGAGKLGLQVLHLLRTHHADSWRVTGFVDDTRPAGNHVTDDLHTIGGLEAAFATHPPADFELVPGIGYRDLTARLAAVQRARRLGYRLATVVHPRAVVEPGVAIGDGCVIMAGAVIDERGQLGEACFIDLNVSISENCRLGAGNFLAAGCALGGSTRLGDANFLGLNATVVDGVTLGDGNVVNAASLVHRSLGDRQHLVQVSAQRLLERTPA